MRETISRQRRNQAPQHSGQVYQVNVVYLKRGQKNDLLAKKHWVPFKITISKHTHKLLFEITAWR